MNPSLLSRNRLIGEEFARVEVYETEAELLSAFAQGLESTDCAASAPTPAASPALVAMSSIPISPRIPTSESILRFSSRRFAGETFRRNARGL